MEECRTGADAGVGAGAETADADAVPAAVEASAAFPPSAALASFCSFFSCSSRRRPCAFRVCERCDAYTDGALAGL